MNPQPVSVPAGPEAPVRSTIESAPADRLVRELVLVLEREAQAVRELRDALARQRDGVAHDSTGAVHASCDDIGRILVTLEAARRARARLLEPIAGPGEAPLAALERVCGGALPEPLGTARAALRVAAEGAAREAAINRAVLRRTIESGEAFLQALFSNLAEPDPTYHAGERPDEGSPGFLLDRKA